MNLPDPDSNQEPEICNGTCCGGAPECFMCETRNFCEQPECKLDNRHVHKCSECGYIQIHP